MLRFASAGVQMWGGYTGHESALIVEGAEEFTDGLTFAAVAAEVHTQRQGISRQARRLAIFLAIGAAALATIDTAAEIVHDGATWLTPLEGVSLANHQDTAALCALGLSTIVLVLNWQGRTSTRVSDKFAYRDAIRDFVIPAMVLILAAMRGPHLAEYMLEAGGIVYGWYNVTQLYKGWRIKRELAGAA